MNQYFLEYYDKKIRENVIETFENEENLKRFIDVFWNEIKIIRKFKIILWESI